jgi:DMSO/TMAO reductase YedYZ molybdopterin-dependent catalytic subunit
MGFRVLASCLLFAALPVLAADPATAPAGPQAVTVLVDGKATTTLDHAALAAMPRTSVTAATHDEKPGDWQGVALEEIVHRAGMPEGNAMRGRAMARFIRVTAADGYQVVFSAGELDPAFGNTQVILAEQKDGQPLIKDGPYRLVVPGDKRAARWVRNVATIEVMDAATRPPG